jgi:SAM-dependent methyltransferase
MNRNRVYNELAELWQFTDPPHEYAEEAAIWRRVLMEKLGPGHHSILELGVGGGCLLSHLTAHFEAVGVDISEQMLAHSRRLNPGVQHILGDMRTVRLGRKFAAVLIHDAISYILSEDELRAAFATARAHLERGGVFIVSPDYFRETFRGTGISHGIARMGGKEVAFIEYEHDPDPNDTTIEALLFFIIKQNGKLRVEQDHHETGLFPLYRWYALLDEAGFTLSKRVPVHRDDMDTYLLVGLAR